MAFSFKECGPLDWGALYGRFDDAGRGDIGPGLIDLQERKYIEIGLDNTAKITVRGMACSAGKDFARGGR